MNGSCRPKAGIIARRRVPGTALSPLLAGFLLFSVQAQDAPPSYDLRACSLPPLLLRLQSSNTIRLQRFGGAAPNNRDPNIQRTAMANGNLHRVCTLVLG